MDINRAFQNAVIVNVVLCLLILGAAIKIANDREHIQSLRSRLTHYGVTTCTTNCGLDD